MYSKAIYQVNVVLHIKQGFRLQHQQPNPKCILEETLVTWSDYKWGGL